MKIKSLFVLFFLGVAIIVAGCHEAEHSASQAFDNANSVLKTGRDKAFGAPEVTPTPY